jgi:hypothetical protein
MGMAQAMAKTVAFARAKMNGVNTPWFSPAKSDSVLSAKS